MINNLLKYVRQNKKLTQKELAKKLNVAQTTLSGYETNYSNPQFKIIEDFLNICDYEIIFRHKKTKKEITSKDFNKPGI